jgi:TonB family protein
LFSIDLPLFSGIVLFAMLGSLSVAAQPASVEIDTASLVRAVKYPSSAARKKIGGFVSAQVTVDSTGKVVGVDLYEEEESNDIALFGPAVRSGIAKAKFRRTPGSSSMGAATVEVNVWFSMQGRGKRRRGVVDLQEPWYESDEVAGRAYPAARRAASVSLDNSFERELNNEIPSHSDATWDTTELQRRVKYPAKAREAGLEGDVIVMTQVSAEGKVLHSITYRSDNRIFEQAAIDAIKDLTMTPARMNNEPISSWVKITVSFRLH